MSHAYVGYCKCGSLVAASVDSPERAKETAAFVAEMIRDGLRVERVDSDVVRVSFDYCACPKNEPAPQSDLFAAS